jgi:hypothetical protein
VQQQPTWAAWAVVTSSFGRRSLTTAPRDTQPLSRDWPPQHRRQPQPWQAMPQQQVQAPRSRRRSRRRRPSHRRSSTLPPLLPGMGRRKCARQKSRTSSPTEETTYAASKLPRRLSSRPRPLLRVWRDVRVQARNGASHTHAIFWRGNDEGLGRGRAELPAAACSSVPE